MHELIFIQKSGSLRCQNEWICVYPCDRWTSCLLENWKLEQETVKGPWALSPKFLSACTEKPFGLWHDTVNYAGWSPWGNLAAGPTWEASTCNIHGNRAIWKISPSEWGHQIQMTPRVEPQVHRPLYTNPSNEPHHNGCPKLWIPAWTLHSLHLGLKSPCLQTLPFNEVWKWCCPQPRSQNPRDIGCQSLRPGSNRNVGEKHAICKHGQYSTANRGKDSRTWLSRSVTHWKLALWHRPSITVILHSKGLHIASSGVSPNCGSSSLKHNRARNGTDQ